MIRNSFRYIKHNLEANAILFNHVTACNCSGDIDDLRDDEVCYKYLMKDYFQLFYDCIRREDLYQLAVYKDTDGTVYQYIIARYFYPKPY